MRALRWLTALLILCSAFAAPSVAVGSDPPLTFVTLEYGLGSAPYYHLPIFSYEIRAEAGPLQFQTAPRNWPESTELFLIEVQDGETEEPIGQRLFTSDESLLSFTLPNTGAYRITFLPLYVEGGPAVSLRAGAINLTLAGAALPALMMPDLPDFTLVDAPLDLTVRPSNRNASIHRILVNDYVLYEASGPDNGSPHTIRIDPAELPNNIYWLRVEAKAPNANHWTAIERSFLIDRTDLYHDLPRQHWARQSVAVMTHLGILNGEAPGRFAPDRPVKRKEFAKMLALTFEIPTGGIDPSPFVDRPLDWSQSYIDALYAAGLILGEEIDGERYFWPDRPISRAEALTIIGRALGIEEADITGYPELFLDAAEVPSWAMASIALLYTNRWLAGQPDGRFHPFDELSRAQAAKVLAIALGLAPGDLDSGAPRPPGLPSGWMGQQGGATRGGFNPGLSVGTAITARWRSWVRLNGASQSAALGNGLLFTAGAGGLVSALLPATGRVLWQTKVAEPNELLGAPVYDPVHNLLFVTRSSQPNGRVTALNPTNGRKLWEQQTDGEWSAGGQSPVLVGDLVVVAAAGSGGTLYAFHAETGALAWRRSAPGTTPAAANGRIFSGYVNGQVFAYNPADGALLWERRNGWSGGGDYIPVLGHGLVYVIDFENRLLALDQVTGQERWRAPDATAVRVDDQVVWVAKPSGGLKVLNPLTGAEIKESVGACLPGAIGASHAFAVCNGDLVAIDRSSFAVTSLGAADGIAAADGDRLYVIYNRQFTPEIRLGALQAE